MCKAGFPSFPGFQISFGIRVAGKTVGMYFQIAGKLIAFGSMDMVFRFRTADGYSFVSYGFKAVFPVNMDLCHRLTANQNWFGRHCGFCLSFLLATAENSLPLITFIAVGMAGVFRGVADQNTVITVVVMKVVFCLLTNQTGFTAVTAVIMCMSISLGFATDRNGLVAAVAVNMILVLGSAAQITSAITAVAVGMRFGGESADQRIFIASVLMNMVFLQATQKFVAGCITAVSMGMTGIFFSGANQRSLLPGIAVIRMSMKDHRRGFAGGIAAVAVDMAAALLQRTDKNPGCIIAASIMLMGCIVSLPAGQYAFCIVAFRAVGMKLQGVHVADQLLPGRNSITG